MTWLEYLRTKRHEQGSVGDLARDWLVDHDRPAARSLGVVLTYLDGCDASEECIWAARLAWHQKEAIQ